MFVDYTDSTEATICGVFSCPQDPTAYPNQGDCLKTDARFIAYVATLPANMQSAVNSMPGD